MEAHGYKVVCQNKKKKQKPEPVSGQVSRNIRVSRLGTTDVLGQIIFC